jgi:hypothetical protein
MRCGFITPRARMHPSRSVKWRFIAEYQFQRDSGWKRGLACTQQLKSCSTQQILLAKPIFAGKSLMGVQVCRTQ